MAKKIIPMGPRVTPHQTWQPTIPRTMPERITYLLHLLNQKPKTRHATLRDALHLTQEELERQANTHETNDVHTLITEHDYLLQHGLGITRTISTYVYANPPTHFSVHRNERILTYQTTWPINDTDGCPLRTPDTLYALLETIEDAARQGMNSDQLADALTTAPTLNKSTISNTITLVHGTTNHNRDCPIDMKLDSINRSQLTLDYTLNF